MVSSTDRFCYQFPAVLRRNPSRIEMVSRDKLEEMVTICLKRWKGQKLPENIIVYRDGVSEGMTAF